MSKLRVSADIWKHFRDSVMSRSWLRHWLYRFCVTPIVVNHLTVFLQSVWTASVINMVMFITASWFLLMEQGGGKVNSEDKQPKPRGTGSMMCETWCVVVADRSNSNRCGTAVNWFYLHVHELTHTSETQEQGEMEDCFRGVDAGTELQLITTQKGFNSVN